MFDKLKAAAGVAGMLKDLPRIKAKLEETKEQLGRVQCTGHSGCRTVRAICNGRLEIISVEIESVAIGDASTPEGRSRLQRATADATNDAMRHARREAATRIADAAQELGIPVPPQLLAQLSQL